MRRLILFFAMIASVAASAASDEAALRRLRDVEQRLHLTPSYKVRFTLVADGVSGEGVLHVEGENSYLLFGAEEVYIEEGVRYIVGIDKREVVIDNNSAYRHDLFSNPSLGFKALLSDYETTFATLDGRCVLMLRPKGSATLDEAIYLFVRDDASIEQIVVGSGDVRLIITPHTVEHNAGSVPRYSSARYAGFEVMDFR